MADLGFADYYEALEVYRELDPASVRIGEATARRRACDRSTATGGDGASLRVPTALAERLSDSDGSPFARAAQELAAGDEVDELHFALVALTNRVLAADRVAPGDDEAVTAVLERAARHAGSRDRVPGPRRRRARGAAALRTIPLVRLFRLGVSLIGKVKRLALALRRARAVRRR